MSPSPIYRWHVACINWGYADAPHAMSYVTVDGEMKAEMYHPTWRQAMWRATDSGLARRIRKVMSDHPACTSAPRDADRVARDETKEQVA